MVRQQFLTGTSFFKLLKILFKHRISTKYFLDIIRLVKVSLISSIFSFIDNILYRRRIKNTAIIDSPVFIIGHWRSGTTFLQKILAQDQQFATPSFYQCALPQAFLSSEKFIKSAISKTLPPTRIFDAMSFGVDEPFDDEFALLKLTSNSYMLHFIFPDKSSFNEHLKLYKINKKRWSKSFLWFAKKITYATGCRLLFKSPMNTLRIKEILKLFPGAKFIYIYRRPEDVFISSLHQANKLFEHNKLTANKTDSGKFILSRYISLFNAYSEDKKLIPKSHLIEIAFEELEKSPAEITRSIYSKLAIDGYSKAEADISAYLRSTRNYKKNVYKITNKERALVNNRWDKAYKMFNYRHIDT
ncbi:MAG: sulfotransferase [Gammaproteobacteria bacterium]|nr:sulfotransferase [Gammaproteobacteria bacterium]